MKIDLTKYAPLIGRVLEQAIDKGAETLSKKMAASGDLTPEEAALFASATDEYTDKIAPIIIKLFSDEQAN